jgi:hypothetical protein
MAIDTPKLIPTPAKSQQGRAVALSTLLDINQTPVGQGKGENFNVPSNYQIPPARIYVINHSRTKKWKRVVYAVSTQRGAEEALIYDKELAKVYNVDTLYKRVEQGKDMNRYKEEVKPVVFLLTVGAPVAGLKPVKPLRIPIPPARDENTRPPKVEVPEGAWDLYLGNYARMKGYARFSDMLIEGKQPDPMVMGEEKSRHALNWRSRHNPVFRITDDGDSEDQNNPYGFLEFVRETVQPVQETMDKEYLAALDMIEAM